MNTELQSHRVFILNTKEQRHNVFFGSGRYKEQLKLLYKVHKVFCRKVFFEHRDTETLRFFRVRKIQRAAKAAFTEDTELSAAMQVPLGGLGGLGAGGFLCRKGSVSSVACDHLYKHHKSLPLLISVV